MSQNNTGSDTRQSIRNHIRPFPASQSPEEKTFVVSWHNLPQTFEKITDALRPQIIKDLFYTKRMKRQYIGDLLQQGWLRLWQALQENVCLFVDLTILKAADFVTNRCGSSKEYDYLKRYDSYHNFSRWNESDASVYEDNITEIVIGSSLKSSGRGGHALFTRVADRLIDIQSAIQEVAEWCGDNLNKLVALYYLTTSVGQVDAGRIAGMEISERSGRVRCTKMTYWTKVVLKRLKEAFDTYCPIEPGHNDWREQIKAGNFEPIKELAQKYSEDADKLLALYVLTTSVARETIVKECGASETALHYTMKRLRQELRYVYARRVYCSISSSLETNR